MMMIISIIISIIIIISSSSRLVYNCYRSTRQVSEGPRNKLQQFR